MSQFSVQTQESLDYFKRLNGRFQRNSNLQEATIKDIQESCAQLGKASEETNKRLKRVLEEKNHCKRDRACLDQDINQFFNVYQNMTPQPEGHALENPYHQGPKVSSTGEYDHMELIDYIDGLFIDLPSLPDYWITTRFYTAFQGHASIWYTEMEEIHGRRK
ncbi:hypothetical protein O181_095602 [Austropuccinia psidii MF-1]|uniref:Uncharacterized protein n=1 Tax=Austropuccinia psidii MF-1 TaxID=1389203 RepID=A0A9Q3J5P0_9BASI|nr:hypothetical protein [Austropuccinia psidii MF-1]